jgi:aspartyl-tRNA(Asn)/glutamyl-tRNA(Gln) amidotransferase subunit A
LKLGIDESLIAEADPAIGQMLDRVVEVLVKAGLAKSKARFADWQAIDHLTQIMQLPDAASAHFAYMMSRPNDYGPQVRARLEVGHFINAVDHMTAQRARGMMLEKVLATTFKDIDVAILPINADPLPTIAELDVAGSPKVQAVMARVVKYCRPINYLGLPTITLPVPRQGGLPNGVQIVAKPFHEGLLFAIGAAYQRLVPPEIAKPMA